MSQTQLPPCPVDTLLEGDPVRLPPTGRLVADRSSTLLDIDGSDADWTGDLAPDGVTPGPDEPRGDAESGYPDLGPVAAFVNRHALYFTVPVSPGANKFEQFEFVLKADGRTLRLGWAPGWDRGWAADETVEWTQLPALASSSFALAGSLEARVPLSDLGSPKAVSLDRVIIMAGECCGPTWRAVDSWKAAKATTRFDRSDPAWRLAPAGGAREADRVLATPDVRAISLSPDGGSGHLRVIGGEGAVPAATTLLVGNLELNDFVRTRADVYGGFEADIQGFPGTHVLIKQDTTRRFIRETPQMFDEDMIVPGVMLRLPVPNGESGVALGSGARICCQNESISWAIEGSLSTDAVRPGDELSLQGNVSLFAGDSITPPDEQTGFALTMIADAAGRQVGRSGHFVSPFLTSTGLPIERDFDSEAGGKYWFAGVELHWEWNGDHWEAEFSARGTLPSEMRPGTYSLTSGGLWKIANEPLEPGPNRPFPVRIRNSNANQLVLGTVVVGDPSPLRLAATLLADEVSEGTRGGGAGSRG